MVDCRNRKNFSLSEKINISLKFGKNGGPQLLAQRFKVSILALATTVQQRAEIKKASAEYGKNSSKLKKIY